MSDPVVLVTGAAGGMGREISRRFARDGWRVAATDLDDAALNALAADVPLLAQVPADLRIPDACYGVLAESLSQSGGRLDAQFLNASGEIRDHYTVLKATPPPAPCNRAM